MNFDEALIRSRLQAAFDTIASLSGQAGDIRAIGDAVRNCLDQGGAIYTCGNGGSAAEALHLAEELIGKYRAARPPRRAVCLNADPTALTCIANDFGFDEVFARQVEALVRRGDALVVFSTSGASPNIVRALQKARDLGATTIGLLGREGGASLPLCDLPLVVRSQETAHIQEAHQVVLHLILEAVEAA
ncbi:MAG: SIS domain-containing protein [Phycisphaeraceae bacterium]|nr:MAG: SIS domain-containing protein [Phycisphaeraceae bacterium]